MWSSKYHPCGYFVSAICANAACMTARSAGVMTARWAPSTAMGTSQESQSNTTKRNGALCSAYHIVVGTNSQSSHRGTLFQ